MFPITNPVAIFLIVLAIILLSPLILNRLKVPYLIGFIIAGSIIGPYGFNILARDASFEIFGQVGIVYLMFLAAVEIDMYHLRKNLDRALLFGLLTSLIPMALGIAACRLFLNSGWGTAVLVGSMFASHTLISYPIVGRFGLSNSKSVVVAVSGTVVAVMIALLALAQVAGSSPDMNPFYSLLWIVAKLIVFCVVIGFTYRFVTRRFFRITDDMVTKYIYVMALVFLAALIAHWLGLEAILGAFYAGLVLNRFIPLRSGLMSYIEFVGNAIFIPYFLIGVGMLINVRALSEGWDVIVFAVVMISIALFSKWFAAWIAQKLFHFHAVGRLMLFGLTAGKAAATIAATIVGYNLGILSENMMNGAVLMILVCCIFASVATERAARRLRMTLTDEELRTDKIPLYQQSRQLVAVSNPMTAEGLMKMAIYMRHPSNLNPVTTLFIRNNDDPALRTMGRNALRLATHAAMAASVPYKDIERYDLNVVSGVTNVVKETDANEIIIGLHRKSNIVDTFYGSLIESLLHATNRMIIMSRCFVPVYTLSRIVVIVPRKAEYETGFPHWVQSIGNLAQQLSSRLVILAYKTTIPFIKACFSACSYELRDEYREMESWDDFIMLSNEIADDDLIIVVGARRSSISFSSDLQDLPNFLSRYYSRHNLIVLYPEQFGENYVPPNPGDIITRAPSSNPSPILLSISYLKSLFRVDN